MATMATLDSRLYMEKTYPYLYNLKRGLSGLIYLNYKSMFVFVEYG